MLEHVIDALIMYLIDHDFFVIHFLVAEIIKKKKINFVDNLID